MNLFIVLFNENMSKIGLAYNKFIHFIIQRKYFSYILTLFISSTRVFFFQTIFVIFYLTH